MCNSETKINWYYINKCYLLKKEMKIINTWWYLFIFSSLPKLNIVN